MIRLVVTGRTGQVAMSLLDRAAAHTGIEVITLGRPEVDLLRPELVRSALAAAQPHVIVNAAAYTAVDRAEQEEALAIAVNQVGAEAVAAAAESLGVPLIHLSTDYVYDGRKGSPYLETDLTAPLNVYGRSKLAGEVAVREVCHEALILRTAWVYSPFGTNFVKTILRLAVERPVLRVVDDQWGNPTSALDLAEAVLRLVPAQLFGNTAGGILHLAGSGYTNWYGLACEILRHSAANGCLVPHVEAIRTVAYPMPAPRPADTRLDMTSFVDRFGFQLPPWQTAVGIVTRRLL